MPTLYRLDESIAFIESHVGSTTLTLTKQENYKDGELYLMRFRQLMMRALSLIRLFVSNQFRALHSSSSSPSNLLQSQSTTGSAQLNGGDSTDTTAASIDTEAICNSNDTKDASLVNGRFRVLSKVLRPLIQELELRHQANQEYNLRSYHSSLPGTPRCCVTATTRFPMPVKC